VWDAAANGSYVVTMRAGEVSDGSGKSVPAGPLGQFVVNFRDVTPPAAALAAADVTTPGGNFIWFTVSYSDNLGVAYATIDGNDVEVSAPNGYLQTGILSNLTVSAGVWTTTYRTPAPGGSWGPEDNGTYTLSMRPNQVADTFGNAVPAGVLGTFRAVIPAPVVATYGVTSAASNPAASSPFSEVPIVRRPGHATGSLPGASQNPRPDEQGRIPTGRVTSRRSASYTTAAATSFMIHVPAPAAPPSGEGAALLEDRAPYVLFPPGESE
jgi:hypothetical protein